MSKEEVKQRADEDLASSDDEANGEPAKKNKYASKNALATSKLDNKRAQKEAIKKNKIKREKGTTAK